MVVNRMAVAGMPNTRTAGALEISSEGESVSKVGWVAVLMVNK